mgnify:CR=1 FL=1
MAQNELPARGQFPKLKLGKKVPKKAEALLIAAFEGEGGLELPGTDLLGGAALRSTYEALVAVGASGKAGEVTRVPAPAKAGVASIIAVGLGDAEEVDDETLRRAAGQAARSITKVGAVATSLGDFGITPVVEGLILGGYKYSGLRSEPSTVPTTFTVVAEKSAQEEFENAKITAESVLLARDLVNTPSNLLYPESYAAFLSAQAAEAGLEVEVLDEKALEKQGFGGEVIVEVLMIIQMVLAEIGETTGLQPDPVQTALVQPVRARLHRGMGDARRCGLGQNPVQRQRIGGRMGEARVEVALDPHRAKADRLMAQFLPDLAGKGRDRGLARGPGDPDHGFRLRRVPQGRSPGQCGARVLGHDQRGIGTCQFGRGNVRALAVGQDRPCPLPQRILDELAPVTRRSRQGRAGSAAAPPAGAAPHK